MAGRERPLGIYTVLMIVSAVFLAMAVLVVWRLELNADYDFGGTEGYQRTEIDEAGADDTVDESAE